MEELFPIVFEMKQLKKLYYQFLGYLVLILLAGFFAFGFIEEGPLLVIGGAKAYFIMALILGVGIAQSRSAKMR